MTNPKETALSGSSLLHTKVLKAYIPVILSPPMHIACYHSHKNACGLILRTFQAKASSIAISMAAA
jgi:hypothetical protein